MRFSTLASMEDWASVSAATNWARKNRPLRMRRFLITGGITENRVGGRY
jgi:hypothetical protein